MFRTASESMDGRVLKRAPLKKVRFFTQQVPKSVSVPLFVVVGDALLNCEGAVDLF